MKVKVFNDTSNYHSGCREVMRYLYHDLSDCGHDIVNTLEEADLVVVNGEGTMHHNERTAQDLLSVLLLAHRSGKKTALVNSVWQRMTITKSIKDMLNASYVSVREVLSQNELKKVGVKSNIHLDVSYFVDVPEIEVTNKDELVVGSFFFRENWRPNDTPNIDIFKDEWDVIVNTLRCSKHFFTGRHHELYAACKARCPFTVIDGNTHKNFGLIETAKNDGVNVNIILGTKNLSEVDYSKTISTNRKRESEYEKLFDWMQKQPKFSFKNI
jgi:polysaccharide pyruvyl transferase WcaK-like protein